MHKLAEPEPRARYLTREEADALLEASAPHIRSIVACALYTGLRRGNILALDWSQIDLGARLITVYGKSKKPGGKRLSVPIATPLMVILRNLGPRDRGPVFTYTPAPRRGCAPASPRAVADIKTGYLAACRRANLVVRFHDLRHTAASWLLDAGVPLDVVQKILGHSDIKSTQRYAHRAPSARRDAVEALGRHWPTNGTISAQQTSKRTTSS